MTTVLDVIEYLESLNVEREAKVAIGLTSEFILDLNREQLIHGKRADGTRMPNYSRASVVVYGKPAGPIMLYDTGNFQGSFKLDVGSEALQILADDPNDLEGRYGEEIYGLDKTNQEYYNQDIFLPELAKGIEEITGLKFN